jgi:hypothetical protein
VLDTVPRAGGRLQAVPGRRRGALGAACLAGPQPPDPVQVAAAVARYRAYRGLREFRAQLYECLTSRPDACFELADAICAPITR